MANLLTDAKTATAFIEGKNSGQQQEAKGSLMMSSLISKKEYLKNKAYKPSHVLNVRPERAGSVDHRLAEGNFFHSNESRKSLQVAADAKSLHKNRM